MSITVTIDLPPNEWSVVSTLAAIHMLQVKDRKSVRLHFGDIRHPPALDTDDFIVMNDYNPKPLAIEYMTATYPQAALFASPDGQQAAKLTAVLLKRLDPTMVPAAGALVAAKVGTPHSRSVGLIATDTLPFVSFSIAAGSLPPGLTLTNTGTITGTPTTAGTYSFTIRADYDGGNTSTAYTLTVAA